MKILQREEQKQGMLLMAKIRRQWDAQEQRFEQELQVNCPWVFSNDTVLNIFLFTVLLGTIGVVISTFSFVGFGQEV